MEMMLNCVWDCQHSLVLDSWCLSMNPSVLVFVYLCPGLALPPDTFYIVPGGLTFYQFQMKSHLMFASKEDFSMTDNLESMAVVSLH